MHIGSSSSDTKKDFLEQLQRPALWLLVLALALSVIFYLLDIHASFDPPYLIFTLNVIIIGIPSFVITVRAARSYVRTGSWAALWIGGSLLTYGISVITSSLLFWTTANAAITIHSIGSLFASMLSLSGAFFIAAGVPPQIKTSRRLVTLLQIYIGSAAYLVIIMLIKFFNELLPPFFVTGSGYTPLREVIIGTTALLFFLAGIIILNIYRKSKSSLLYWYSFALLATALGMSGTLMETLPGTPLNWIGRSALLLGGLYMTVGAIVVQREARALKIPAEETMASLLRRAESPLEESEERFRNLVDTAPVQISVSRTSDGTVLFTNRNYEQTLGFAPGEAIGIKAPDLYYNPADRTALVDILAKQGFVRDFEFRFKRKDGSLRWLSSSSRTIQYRGESAILGAALDITERKHAEEELRKAHTELEQRVQERTEELRTTNEALLIEMSERQRAEIVAAAERQQFFDILETMPSYVILLTPDYHVRFANKVFRERFGESHGKRCYEFLFGRTEPCEICDTYKVLKTMQPLEWEWTGPDKRNYYIYDFPFTDTDGTNLIMETGIDITLQKKAQEALRQANEELEIRIEERTRSFEESEAKYRTIVTAANEGIWVADAERRIVFVNAKMAEMLGYTVDEMMAKSWWELTDPDSRTLSSENYEKRKYGETTSYELKMIQKDGTRRWILVKSTPQCDTTGKFSGSISMLTDITERKEAEAEISRLASFPELNPNPVVEMDASGLVTYANPSAISAFPGIMEAGNKHPAVNGWEALFSEFKAGTTQFGSREIIFDGAQYLQSILYLRNKGLLRFYSQDITRRKQAEDSLRETRDYLDNLFNYANAPIITWDTGFKITRFNHAFEHLTGQSAADVIGKPLDILFPEDTRQDAMKLIHTTLTGEHWESVEIPILNSDGAVLTILWNSATIFAADGKTPVATIAQGQDITERKRAELQLIAYRNRLEELVGERTLELQKANVSLKREILTRSRAEERVRVAEASLRHAIYSNIDGMVIINKTGKILFSNPATEMLFGRSSPDMLGTTFSFPVITHEFMEIEIQRDDGTTAIADMRMAETVWEDEPAYLTMLRDITEIKEIEKREEVHDNIYRLFLEAQSQEQYLQQAVNLLREYTGCRCLGIRIQDGNGNIPYLAQEGFSKEFLDSECQLSLKRDQCACIRVIAGTVEQQDLPAMTAGGSFYSRDVTAFASKLTTEQLARFRGVCIKAGFHTVSIIPIRYSGQILGAIHIADERKEALPPKALQLIELVSPLIGEAIHRFRVEEDLRENQARLSEAQRIGHLGNWDWNIETNELTWSDEVYAIFGLTPQDGQRPQSSKITYDTFISIVHRDDREMVQDAVNGALRNGEHYDIEHRIILPDGTVRVVHEIGEVTVNEAGKPVRMFGTVHDITVHKRVEQELRTLSHRIVEAQENERRNIAREMHDVLGQSLTVLKLILDKATHVPPENVGDSLKDAQETVDEVVQRVRNLSLELRPSMLDDLGLLPTLLWYTDRYSTQSNIKINFHHNELDMDFPVAVSTAAYRIIQEALTNATRYAKVKELTVNAWTDRKTLFLTIEDRGAGFDPAKLVAGTSSGLSGMKERALALGGKLTIDSTPGVGTTVTAELPISKRRGRGRKKE